MDPRDECRFCFEAEQLSNSSDCPKKENGRKIEIMELTKRIFDQKGYAYLQLEKTQEIYEINMQIW